MRDAGTYTAAVDDSDLDDVEGTYDTDGGAFLVGTLDGTVVAMGALRPADEWFAGQFDAVREPAGVVTRMRVAPSHQRQGYGQRLLTALQRRARAMGYRELLLDTDPRQDGTQRFYEANGFRRVGTVDVDAVDDCSLVLYRKRLPP